MIPPLSQSKQSLLECPARYFDLVVKGNEAPPTADQQRGRVIHEILATYLRHLLTTKQQTDYTQFEKLCAGVEPSAVEVLANLKEKIVVDPEGVFGTEVYIALAEDLSVVEMRSFQQPGKKVERKGRKNGAALEMTLDVVKLPTPRQGRIEDWKSWRRIADPDTFQGKLYALGLFQVNQDVDEIQFVLEFVRYGVHRQVTYRRDMIPELAKEVLRWRAYQRELHERLEGPDEIEAIPGAHCATCRLLMAGCPIGKLSPFTGEHSPEQRLKLAAYHQQAYQVNRELLKEHVKEHGTVKVGSLEGGYKLQTRTTYPATDCLPIIHRWDQEMKDNLVQSASLSGISTKLKSKKREDLADQLANVCLSKTISVFKVGEGEEAEENGE